MPRIAATSGLAVTVVTPLSNGESRSIVARALARSACSAFFSTSSVNLRRTGPGPAPIASIRETSDGASGWIKAVIRASDAALEFSASFPVALARSKLPLPSVVTPLASPNLSWSRTSVCES